MFITIVIFFAISGIVVGYQFTDTTKTEAELAITAWALVGVIVGCGVATYFGIVQKGI